MKRISISRRGLVLALLSGMLFDLSAQTSPELPAVGVQGIYFDGVNYIRWAPTSLSAFELGKSDGYLLERATYAQADTVLSQESYEQSIITLNSQITPVSQGSWGGVDADTSLKNAAVEILYTFDYTEPDPDSINVFEAFDEEEAKRNVITFVSIIADRDWDVAEAMGLGYIDTSVTQGSEYVYILTLLNSGGPDEKFYTFVSSNESYSLAAPPKPFASGGDSLVFLAFSTAGLDQYYGYYIERSDNMGGSYSLISDVPFIFDDEKFTNTFRAVDSIPSNDSTYVYRIAGASYYGLQGPWSDTVHVKGVHSPIDAAFYITELEVDGSDIEVHWEFPSAQESEIVGFEVIRGYRREGPFQPLHQNLLGPSVRSFVDEEPLRSNYYFVRVYDQHGYMHVSLPQYYAPPDTIAPAVPTGLSGVVDDHGWAQLSWSANDEFDIRGYRLYAANDTAGLFVEITNGVIKDTTYMYKLSTNVMNTYWYVKMLAVDHNENQSEFSSIIQLGRPDVIPPSAPVLKDVNVIANGIGMNWILSKSDDVVLHVLERKRLGTNQWNEILDITNNYTGQQSVHGWEGTSQQEARFNLIDTTVVPRNTYAYRVLAFDDNDNVSSSVIIEATAYDNGLRGVITDLEAVDNTYSVTSTVTFVSGKTVSAIAVGWDYTEPEGLHSFTIYRSADGWPYQTYESYLVYDGRPNPALLTDDAHLDTASSGLQLPYVFIDKGVKTGTTYSYKIMAKHFDGGFSPMSEPVTVTTD